MWRFMVVVLLFVCMIVGCSSQSGNIDVIAQANQLLAETNQAIAEVRVQTAEMKIAAAEVKQGNIEAISKIPVATADANTAKVIFEVAKLASQVQQTKEAAKETVSDVKSLYTGDLKDDWLMYWIIGQNAWLAASRLKIKKPTKGTANG